MRSYIMDSALRAAMRVLMAMATGLAIAMAYTPASGVLASAVVILLDMWVSDIVSALKERKHE